MSVEGRDEYPDFSGEGDDGNDEGSSDDEDDEDDEVTHHGDESNLIITLS
jgi:hypothetical protein